MADVDTFETSQQHFVNLENKLKRTIMQCSDKNLVESFNKYDALKLGVKNATDVAHYQLENGLHVYKFLNGNQPIDYWIAGKPLYESYTYRGTDGKECQGKKFNGNSGLEYSAGGIGNSLPLDGVDHYSTQRIVAVMIPGPNKAYLKSDIQAAEGFPIQGGLFSTFKDYCYYSAPRGERSAAQYFEEGDLVGYISACQIQQYQPDNKAIKEDLLDTFGKIDQLTISKQNEPEKKRGFLKGLLSRNKDLDQLLDPFTAEKSKGK